MERLTLLPNNWILISQLLGKEKQFQFPNHELTHLTMGMFYLYELLKSLQRNRYQSREIEEMSLTWI